MFASSEFWIGVAAGLGASLAATALVHFVGIIVIKRKLIDHGEGYP